jgi:MFS family permease
MREIFELIKHEPRARRFFIALGQSALGTGAALVALLVISLERFDSPWAIGLVLLADVIPGMVLGPLFGAVADRWSRRACVIAADVIRAAAFAGLVLVDGFGLTLTFALFAGIGTALFQPASLAALPGLVERARLPAATSLYGALTDVGYVAGPAIAALLMLAEGPELVLGVNAVTFALSALLLATIRFGEVHAHVAEEGGRPSLVGDIRDGFSAAAHIPGLRLLLLASTAALFCGGVFNVAELLLATEEFGTSSSGYSVLVAIYGVGFIGGSVAGARGGALPVLRRRYLAGILLAAIGTGASGLAPSAEVAAVCFVGAGYGAGLLLVHERLLIQELVPEALGGRIFGMRDALTAWAWAVAFVTAPLLLTALGTRETVVLAGAGAFAVWIVAAWLLRRAGRGEEISEVRPEELSAGGRVGRGDLARSGSARENGPDLVSS